jgi:hypothetical protein
LIITASTEPGWLEALLPLTWRGINPTILLLDPQSFGGTGTTTNLESLLQQLGLTCHVITRDLLNRPEAHPGHRGQWEWRSTPTGRAIARQAPANSEWGKLS